MQNNEKKPEDVTTEPLTQEELDECVGSPQADLERIMEEEEREKQREIEAMLHKMGTVSPHETLFRDDIIREICAILLSESKPNALLIGPAGSGKTQIVEELAKRIRRESTCIPKILYGYKVYSLNISDIVSGSSLVGALEAKVEMLISFLEADDHKAILFLDEAHVLFQGSTQYKEIAQMLKPALSRGKIKVIAATTTQEVKAINTDPAFNRRFTRVLVDELTKEQTEKVLKSAVKRMEKHYETKIDFNNNTAKLLIRTADEFCSAGSHRPDNALTLFDRAIASRVIDLQIKGLSADTIILDDKLVEETAIRLTSGNSRVRAFNEDAFCEAMRTIRGQGDILEDLTKAVKLYDLHLRPHNRPLTFLFAGPSGVGKSEVAKILAREYVGEKPIVLNMAEFSSETSISRIIGAPEGYLGSDSNRELPFDVLDTNPYQVILLDEFEKATRSVQRLFMSVFDEGVMVTSLGKEIDFSKSIIIATTNAGCTMKTGSIGFDKDDTMKSLTVTDLSAYFDTELINRFSHRYTFHGISKDIYAQIIRDTLIKEISSLNLDKVTSDVREWVTSMVTDEAVALLCDKTYDEKLGARPASTAVSEYIDDLVLLFMTRKKERRFPEPSGSRKEVYKAYRPAILTRGV